MLQFEIPATHGLSQSNSVATSDAMAIAVAGFRIPWLTDVLANPIYGGNDRAVALTRFLSDWQQQVYTLSHAQSAAFSIRLVWDPARGSVDIYGLTRVIGFKRRLLEEASHTSNLLPTILRNYEWEVEPLSDSALGDILRPSWIRTGYEVRQGEILHQAQVLSKPIGIYSILPFAKPSGDWRELLVTLMAQQEPVLVNLLIQPTRLQDDERLSISSTAITAKRLISVEMVVHNRPVSFKNPQAETAFRIYSTLENRLERPFLASAHVFSQSERVAGAVATSLGAAVIARAVQDVEQQAAEIPSDFSSNLISRDYSDAVNSVLSHLWLTPCSPPSFPVPNERRRLRYLVDSRGAASIFRLPVPRENGLPGIEVRKRQGGHETGRRTTTLPKNHVLLGHQADGHTMSIDVKDLTRHGLICGMHGSGKTNTSLNLLAQLWRDYKVPFWVFEPPSTEYRGLLKQPGFEDLLVFTLGDEGTSPLRLNPFELLPGISIEQHVANLKACFVAALPKLDESGQLVGMFMDTAIRSAYKTQRWRFQNTLEDKQDKNFPTLHSLLPQLARALSSYAGENRTNLQAAMDNRIRSLLRGSKGRMFNVERGIPVEALMGRPVIFELAEMGADAPLALMFLLNLLQEHASKRRRSHPLGIEHVILVEEAHVIMAHSHEQSGASAGVAAIFERMLAELRKTGEGVLIAEQSPTKLVKGAINLTNLKIVHQLSGTDEVSAVGGAMAATDQQKNSFQGLGVGQAAVFMRGLQGLGFFTAPNFKGDSNYEEQLPNADVRSAMAGFYKTHQWLKLPFQGCAFCEHVCLYKGDIERVVFEPACDDLLRDAALSREHARSDATTDHNSLRLADYNFYGALGTVGARAGHPAEMDAAWCVWVQAADEDFVFERIDRRDFKTGFEGILEDIRDN